MPLARGEGPVRDVGDLSGSVAAGASAAIVIAIAPDPSDQVRLATLVTGHAPLLLVSTAQQAMDVLTGRNAQAPNAEPAPQPVPDRQDLADLTGLHLDSDRRQASWAGESVGLSPLEHDLLRCLVAAPGRTWAFARLHEEVWGNSHLGRRADVHSVVKRVRRKLRQLGSPLEIETVRGVGLRLVDITEELLDDVPLRPVPVPDQPATPTIDAFAD